MDSINTVLTAFLPTGMQYVLMPEFSGMTGPERVPFTRHMLDSLPVRALPLCQYDVRRFSSSN